MRFLLAFTMIMVFSFSDCQKPTPTSDSTPPSLIWVIVNENDNETTEIKGNATIPAYIGDRYRVTLKAEDPEGVHEISLGGETYWGCQGSGGLAQKSGPSLEKVDKQVLEPNNEGKVLTSIFLMREVELSSLPCQSGYTFSGGAKTFYGTGKNYFGGEIKKQLKFTFFN